VDKKKDEGVVEMPADLTSLSDADLDKLEEKATKEFDAHLDSGEGDPDARLTRASELADIIDAARGEKGVRAEAATQRDADAQALRDRVRPPAAEPEPTPEPELVPAAEPAPVPVPVAATTQQTQQPVANGVTDTLLAGGPIREAPRKLNPTLSDIQRQNASLKGASRRNPSVLVASAEIPNVQQGSQLKDMDALVAAMHLRARSLPVGKAGIDATMYPVASMQLDHRFTLDLLADPAEVNEVLQASADVDALVAAGGWCSPSEISYDFYNIVCEDGMLDLPTVGINRGGMRWPTSASYGDIVSNYWSWNETQDIAALTGTAQSGTKVCYRVPCPAFNEERLHCDGFCLTVGNLMEDSFPELIANHTRLLFAGHAHRMNTLRINTLISAAMSTGVTGNVAGGNGVVAPVLGFLELQAIDYREKYRMCEDAVLEVVLPRWLRGAMRSDLRKRTGMGLEALAVTDAMLMNMFDLLNIRIQWVTDWQVGTTGFPGGTAALTLWPTTVQFLMYAAGTFVLGRGLQLNLGVIRDSVMNLTNDHTAEWMEECWLIAKIGHESRLGTISICPDGTTGAADLTACAV
jgi:hypothetical protein